MQFASGIFSRLSSGSGPAGQAAGASNGADATETDRITAAFLDALREPAAWGACGTTPEGLLLPASHEEDIDGYGVVPVVTEFLPGIDRLLLDFDPGRPEPEITLNTAIEPRSTAVMGDGLLMVMLRDVTGVSTADVVVGSGAPADADATDGEQAERFLSDPDVPFFADFDCEQDLIEVIYDPGLTPNPAITLEPFPDGTGASVLLNGLPVLDVAGAEGLTASDVVLIPRSADAEGA